MCSDGFNVYGTVVRQSYKDVICLVPEEKLDTKFYIAGLIVMKFFDKIFLVMAVSVDNYICNR